MNGDNKRLQYPIQDSRKANEFSQITFSGYKKSEVKKNLIKNILAGKIESGCFWSAEYICAGHFAELWDIFITIMSKNIHAGNPKLPIYIFMRYNDFRKKANATKLGDVITLRNDKVMRKLFCEVICVLCFSNQKHALTRVKIDIPELNIVDFPERLQAKRKNLAKEFYKGNDSSEIYIAVNEFVHHLTSNNKNTLMACYWVEWTMKYEKILKQKARENKKNGDKKQKKNEERLKSILECNHRKFPRVDEKHKKDWIWIYWQIMLHHANRSNSKVITNIVHHLFQIFCIRYSPGCKTKRIWVIYNAITLLTDYVNLDVDVIKQGNVVEKIKRKINLIYGQIKKNEIRGKKDNFLMGFPIDL